MPFAKIVLASLTVLTAQAALATPRGPTVKFTKVGNYERSDGMDIASTGTESGTDKVLAKDVVHLSVQDEYSFRLGLADGRKLLVSNLDVHLPGEGNAQFKPIVYGYPESASAIVETARHAIAFHAHQAELRAKYEAQK